MMASMDDAPQRTEVEVTPEMVAAGLREIAHYRAEFSNEEDVVAAIFKRMSEVKAHFPWSSAQEFLG